MSCNQTHCARQGHPPNSENSVNPPDECSMCYTPSENAQAPNEKPSTTAINAIKWLGGRITLFHFPLSNKQPKQREVFQ